ncbi:MAG: tetratricopeptide repeat protein [Alphaproteobacteria bacterium]|nr:tetratricopeptide repeat protein [Alphaproteobacteria bacterium]
MPKDGGGSFSGPDDIVGFPLSGGFDSALVAGLRIDKARRALDQGHPAQALVEAEELLDSHPDHVQAMLVSARAAVALGDGPMALAAIDAIAQRQPDADGLSLLRAHAAFVALDEETAWRQLQLHHAAQPDDPAAWRLHAAMARCSDPPRPAELERARTALGGALPDTVAPDALADLLDAVLDALDEEHAEWLEEAHVACHPHPPRALLERGLPPGSPLIPFLLLQDPEPEDAPIEVHAFASAIDARTAADELAAVLADLLERQVAR